MLTESKKELISMMLEAGVLRFGEFTLKSGRVSPYFINTGNYKSGKHLAALGKCYADLVKRTLGANFDGMFGPAYKGIPLVSACAIALWEQYGIEKPYLFDRKEAKDHGEGGSIVGYIPNDGEKIIIIEDVISSGISTRESMTLLKSYNVKVTDMFISVDRMEYGQVPGKTAVIEVSELFGLRVHPLINVDDIREWLVDTGWDAKDISRMDEYREKYCVR